MMGRRSYAPPAERYHSLGALLVLSWCSRRNRGSPRRVRSSGSRTSGAATSASTHRGCQPAVPERHSRRRRRVSAGAVSSPGAIFVRSGRSAPGANSPLHRVSHRPTGRFEPQNRSDLFLLGRQRSGIVDLRRDRFSETSRGTKPMTRDRIRRTPCARVQRRGEPRRDSLAPVCRHSRVTRSFSRAVRVLPSAWLDPGRSRRFDGWAPHRMAVLRGRSVQDQLVPRGDRPVSIIFGNSTKSPEGSGDES
jgi:hypothetical protein